ncbi:hypothetical protein B0H14DRAFT_3713629 [Mycena olivaceomarginata]|nr:hypothetical protein B0H14DRAFT_3713629 [Mycena olivaceomarginata]
MSGQTHKFRNVPKMPRVMNAVEESQGHHTQNPSNIMSPPFNFGLPPTRSYRHLKPNKSTRCSSCLWTTAELLTIIGIFMPFFALETTLPEWQSLCALAKLIGWHVARLNTCELTLIVEFREEGCIVFLFFFLLFPHLYVDTLQKYLGTTERVHKGLVDVFEKKGWKILTPHRGWERCGQCAHQKCI